MRLLKAEINNYSIFAPKLFSVLYGCKYCENGFVKKVRSNFDTKLHFYAFKALVSVNHYYKHFCALFLSYVAYTSYISLLCPKSLLELDVDHLCSGTSCH